MGSQKTREEARDIRHLRIRKKVRGTPECPRVSVYRGNRHLYAQIIDDEAGNTLVSASTLSPELKGKIKKFNIATAKELGMLLASKAKGKGIEKVVFDRGGYKYHGKIKALADAAREGGLKF